MLWLVLRKDMTRSYSSVMTNVVLCLCQLEAIAGSNLRPGQGHAQAGGSAMSLRLLQLRSR